MPSEKPLLSFVVDKELLDRVEDFRFSNRFTSRSAAIKWLLEWALAQNPELKEGVSHASQEK